MKSVRIHGFFLVRIPLQLLCKSPSSIQIRKYGPKNTPNSDTLYIGIIHQLCLDNHLQFQVLPCCSGGCLWGGEKCLARCWKINPLTLSSFLKASKNVLIPG